MSSFKDLNSLLQAVKKQVKDVAQNEVSKEIKSVMKKHIDEDVYEAYTPHGSNPYERRYEEGLGNENNINVDIQDSANGIDITTTDTTKANGDDYGEALVPYIEEGIYNWKHKPPKRPFLENTAKELKNGTLEKALKEGLRKRGIDTK